MSVVGRGVRNAFRSPARVAAIVVILGLTIGLSFVMLVGHRSVENKIGATLASIGTTVSIAPAGYSTASTVNDHLTTGQLSQLAQLPHVVSLDEALPGSLPSESGATSQSAARRTTLLPSSPGEPVSFVGTNEPSDASNIGASILRIMAGHVIDGTGDSRDAMVSSTVAERNHLKVGSAFRAYGAVLTVKAIFQSDTDNGNAAVIVPLATEQRLSHRADQVTSAAITVDSLTNLSAVTGAITATLGPAAKVTSDAARAGQAIAPLKSVKSLSFYSLLGAAGTAAGIILLVMVMTVREREREVGIVKAIGGSTASIVLEFMTEALTFAILGGTAGVIGGALAASSITSGLVSSSGHPRAAQVHATATMPEILIGLAGILLIAAFGSAAASWLISRIQPAEALRSE